LANIWIETDYLMLVNAFYSNSVTPWPSSCTHTHRERNLTEDALVKNGQRLPLFASQCCSNSPLFLAPFLFGGSTGLSYQRKTFV